MRIKGKINKLGCLEIDRKIKFVEQYCPVSQNDVRCGDWCPLFGEPEYEDDATVLVICQNKVLLFEKETFLDERF